MAKQTFWTKCGRQFKKNSTATVTGYELALDEGTHGPNPMKDELRDEACRVCPFIVEVTEGWGGDKKHIRWECRAGSRAPNHKTEWVGSLEDKNTIQINSLDHQFLEEILRYCKKHPDLGAGYNADHLADCRRTLSINCSSNKKGIAAKKELIEKFFPEQMPKNCRSCANFEAFKKANHGGSLGNCHKNGGPYPVYIPDSKRKCENFVPIPSKTGTEIGVKTATSTRQCGNCSIGHWFSGEYTYVSVVQDGGKKTIKRPCEPHTHYCHQITDGQKKIAVDKDFNPDIAPEWCPLEKETPKTCETCTQILLDEDFKELGMRDDEVEKDGKRNDVIAEKNYKPKCPYLSSHGEDFIDCCAPNARRLNTVKFGSKKACSDKTDEHCYGRFHECEDYQKYYADPTTWDDWAVPERRTCIYCCNNSWYTGLPEGYSGQKYCFCQIKQEPVEHDSSPCEWFNRHPDWALPRIGSQGCSIMKKDCPCFCAHNDGCAVLLMKGDALKSAIEDNQKYNIECAVYREVSNSVAPKEQKPDMYQSCGNDYNNGNLPLAKTDNCETYTLDIVDAREVKLNNYISDIKGKSQKIVLDYIKIGLTLLRINNDKLYEVKGYSSLIEFAQAELGFSKTLLYNTMAIAQKFGQNTENEYTKEGYIIDQRYKEFSLSQLTEMISIADERLTEVTPDMTVKEIREYKQEIKVEEIQNSNPRLKELDEYFKLKGFDIGKSAFSISYSKQIKYAGEYYKDGYGIDMQIDQDFSTGEFDIIKSVNCNGKGDKIPFGFEFTFEGGLDGCINEHQKVIRQLQELKYAENINMLSDTFVQNSYIPQEDYEMEIEGENEGPKITAVQWNYSFNKDSYNVEITAEFVKGNFDILIYDNDMIVNHSYNVADIEDIFPKLIECWSRLIPIEKLSDICEKIENCIKGVISTYSPKFLLDTQEFAVRAKKMGYEFEIRTDVEMTLATVTYCKVGDNSSTQNKMTFAEVPGFIGKLTEVKTAAAGNENMNISTVAAPERVAIKVPAEVRTEEGEDEIEVPADKDVKAIHFLLSKMEQCIKLHKENQTIRIAEEERDPMAAYYILKDFLIEYYEITANIK